MCGVMLRSFCTLGDNMAQPRRKRYNMAQTLHYYNVAVVSRGISVVKDVFYDAYYMAYILMYVCGRPVPPPCACACACACSESRNTPTPPPPIPAGLDPRTFLRGTVTCFHTEIWYFQIWWYTNNNGTLDKKRNNQPSQEK